MSGEGIPVAQPEAAKAAGSQFQYDVFISYSHKDKSWVTLEFLPELEQAGLRVMSDARDVSVGIQSIQNMTEAMERARYIIPVLTPNWVASEWTAFEGYLL